MSHNTRRDNDVATKLYNRGYTELVSVIPPDGDLSPYSKIDPGQRGKCPGEMGPHGWRGYNFTKESIDPATIDEWRANIGLLGNRFPALDIDSDFEKLTQLVRKEAESSFGPSPYRTSRHPRGLLVYRTKEPFPKMVLKVRKGDESAEIEWLGKGRQYLIHGRHPSGVDYGWEGAPLWEVDPETLPWVSRVSAQAFFEHLATLLRDEGFDVEIVGDGRVKEAPPQEDLKAPSIKELEELIARIPNTYETRDEWIRFGIAIRAAAQDDVIAGLEMFQDFSGRWKGGENDPDLVERTWDSLKPPFEIGWKWLRGQGFKVGEDTLKEELSQERVEEIQGLFEADQDAPEATEGPACCSDALSTALKLIGQLGPNSLATALDTSDRVLAMLPTLDHRERTLAEAALTRKLDNLLGRQGAQDVLNSVKPSNGRAAFVRDADGVPVLRALNIKDIRLEDRYLVDGRIPAAGVGAIVSDFSLGKTWLVIDLGCSVAFGRPWLGSETTQQPVIFLIAEGNRDFPKRIFGWLVEHGYLRESATLAEMEEVLRGRVIISEYPPRFDDPVFETGLINTINQTGAGLVIIDTLGKTLGAEQSENDNDTANAITGLLSRFAAETDCTSLFTHHVGYGDSDRLRGASAWEQGLDFSYVIKGTREALDSGNPMTLKTRKMRDGGHKPLPLGFRLKGLTGLSLTTTDDSEPTLFASAVVELVDVPRELSLLARVFQFIESEPGCAAQHIRDRVEGRNGAKQEAVRDLIHRGAIENRRTGNRHRYYAIPGWRAGHGGRVENVADLFDLVDESATEDEEVGS